MSHPDLRGAAGDLMGIVPAVFRVWGQFTAEIDQEGIALLPVTQEAQGLFYGLKIREISHGLYIPRFRIGVSVKLLLILACQIGLYRVFASQNGFFKVRIE
jgi:hypothetical protein